MDKITQKACSNVVSPTIRKLQEKKATIHNGHNEEMGELCALQNIASPPISLKKKKKRPECSSVQRGNREGVVGWGCV